MVMKTIRFWFLVLVGCFWSGVALYAAPAAKGVARTYVQADGETLTLYLDGDEYLHYWTTCDGIPVVQAADGYWYYARSIRGKSLVGSDCLAKEPGLRTEHEQAKAGYFFGQVYPMIQNARAACGHSAASLRKGAPPTTGQLRGLVIMAQFPDRSFTDTCTAELMDRVLNEEGYKGFGMTGSARDYFMDQSGGKFEPSFDVVGPVTLSREMEYYGADSIEQDIFGTNIIMTDMNLGKFIQEACQLADSEEGVDFSVYDNNDDGEADLVFVIYAGYAESQGASTNTIWPQMSYLADTMDIELILDGVRINRFACSSELSGFSGGNIAGIGTFCHEFSHTLGLMDVYGSSGMLSMSYWDLMDNGLYNNNACTPSGYSSFEKIALGWMEPVVLSEAQDGMVLPPFESSHQAYKILSDSNESEYFLLENRQKSGKWDSAIPGEGLLVIHVNYDAGAWASNRINADPENMRLHLVPANADFTAYSDLPSVPFPGTLGKTDLTPLTEPLATWHDGTVLNQALTNIRESGDTVLFDFGQKLETPVALPPANLGPNSFTALWEEVTDAENYTVVLTCQSTGEERRVGRIADTRYTFGGLEVGETYVYKVQAQNELLVSDFSNEIVVSVPTGAEPLQDADGWHLYVRDGVLYVESDSDVYVYDLSGRERVCLSPYEAARGLCLPGGFYLVRSGGQTRKVLL